MKASLSDWNRVVWTILSAFGTRRPVWPHSVLGYVTHILAGEDGAEADAECEEVEDSQPIA